MKLANRVFIYCGVLGLAYGTLWWGLREPEPARVHIDAGGQMQLDGARVDRHALEQRLRQTMREAPRVLHIEVAPTAPPERLVEAMQAAREAGAPQIEVTVVAD